MKVLVSPPRSLRGTSLLDFDFTTPGEVLLPTSSKCSNRPPEGRCGCRRSFSGATSGKAATVGIVADLDVDLEGVARAAAQLAGERPSEIREDVERARDLGRRLRVFGVGDRVGVRFEGPDATMLLVVRAAEFAGPRP